MAELFNLEMQLKLNKARIVSGIKKACEKAQWPLDVAVKKSMWPYTPYLTGKMMGDIEGTGTGELRYPNSPQARRLYWGTGFNFTKDHHPLAGAKWFQRAKEIDGKKWILLVTSIVALELQLKGRRNEKK